VLLSRQAFLQQLSDAVDTFEQLQSHLKEGAAFYAELSTRIGQLQQTVDDHCAARDLERRELELHVQADDAQRQREAHDAVVAAQMMRDMQLRDDSNATVARDEAMARQLAGGVPQHFQQPTNSAAGPSGMYAAFPPPAPSPPQQQQHPYAAYQQTPPSTSTNASAPPPAYSSIFSSSPSSTPQFGNYYYAQQQQPQQPQYHHQQQQPNTGYSNNSNGNNYYQYPGAAPYPQNHPGQPQHPPPNGQSLFPHPLGNSSV
jgi:programmed cell death 6-interacting protein